MSDSIIQIKDVNKWYGDFQVLKDINLEVKTKEKIVVCGPSFLLLLSQPLHQVLL